MKVHVLTYGQYANKMIVGVFAEYIDARLQVAIDQDKDPHSLAHEGFEILPFEVQRAGGNIADGAAVILEHKAMYRAHDLLDGI